MGLTINDISKSFNERTIINHISFTVKKGEFISIIGPSGSGKSTLFNMIGGLLTPDDGDILMNNKSIKNKRGHISYMPQHPSLFPWRSVLNNALLGQELYGDKDIKIAKEMLEKAGLAHVINSYPNELSGGMKQRVAFIRALLSPQSLMCLDEPFSALDEFTRLDMQKWLLEMWKDYDKSILFITHDIEEALFLSDKIIILSTQPAKIKQIYDIPFKRPRDEALLLTDEFLHAKRDIINILKNN